jgi:hypothetical protein
MIVIATSDPFWSGGLRRWSRLPWSQWRVMALRA